MAYVFVGANNDQIDFGSDASIDNTIVAVAAWARHQIPAGSTHMLITKSDGQLTPTGFMVKVARAADTGHIEFQRGAAVTPGTWVTANNTFPVSEAHHVAVSAVNGTAAPNIYIDGVLMALTNTIVQAGAYSSDANEQLIIGSNTGASGFLDGHIGHLVCDNVAWTAADVNRARWWGVAPSGSGSAVLVYHPLWTESLTNKGTATANGTLSASITRDNASLPRVQRPGD